MTNHIVNHTRHPEMTHDNVLHVVGVLFNPMRYQSRLRIFREWLDKMKATKNVKVYVVELAFGDRQFECTDSNDPTHLQIRAYQEIWHKESLYNLAVKHLLPTWWKYLCWCDADVFFTNPEWAQEAIHQMQHFELIQPWSDCVDLGRFGNVLGHFKSFCYQHRRKVKKQTHPSQPYEYAHSGFAWCCTRDFWESIEKLIDFAILGSADHHMAFASINEVDNSLPYNIHENFKRLCYEWQRKAFFITNGRLGYVPGHITHEFHGPKYRRRYRERWEILTKYNFDPVQDITYDGQGLVKLVNNPQLLDACYDYFIHRQEDSIQEHE